MKFKFALILLLSLQFATFTIAQEKEIDPTIENIVKEANENSQLEKLGHQLLEVIGPR